MRLERKWRDKTEFQTNTTEVLESLLAAATCVLRHLVCT